MEIILFDMDGVLLEPHGYHRALQETVRLVGASLGIKTQLTQADIVAFESAGVFSEWDTSAICAALILQHLWQADPALEIPPSLATGTPPRPLQRPLNHQAFAMRLAGDGLGHLRPLERAGRLLLHENSGWDPRQRQVIDQVLQGARSAESSLTHRTFQELILGSQVYFDSYHLPPVLNINSYLEQFDRPLLTPPLLAGLNSWLQGDSHRAAIFTSRPSQPLPGIFSTPEAEMGARLVGLEHLPVLGLGGLLWLEGKRQVPRQSFLKPSPVHALSALMLACGIGLEGSLLLAAGLALDGEVASAWWSLAGSRIAVMEDSGAGLRSAIAAGELLARAGVTLTIELYGVTPEPQKAAALAALGGEIFPSLSLALEKIWK